MDAGVRNFLRHLKIEARNYYKCKSRGVPKTKMRTNKLSLIRKLTIAEEAIIADNVKATAKKYKVFPAQIRKWKLMITELRAAAQITPKN